MGSRDASSEAGFARSFDELPWDDRFVRELPGDPLDDPRPRAVEGAAYSHVLPTRVAAPRTLAHSPELAAQLGLSPELVASQEFTDVLSGNRIAAGSDPFAMAYGGHQFGAWAGQLGDGRAINLGEVVDVDGRRQVLQLKGAGATPYSRFADGRAVLRSSLREFLCSEAMHHLGIATTRGLSLVTTGDEVVRDVMYDGHPAPEPGAITCRVAESFLRLGSYQLPASRGDASLLRELVEFTIRHHFPGMTIAELFDEVCRRTADLVVDWMRVGFVHGVLNTDNMSILGLTIDYGPYGWLEDFDPDWTPNTTDAEGRRYRFGDQPRVAQWNLLQLADALVQLTEDPAPLQGSLERYAERYAQRFDAMLAQRLGWDAWRDEDAPVVTQLFETLRATEVDQVIFFRELARVPVGEDTADDALLAPLAAAWYRPEDIADGEARAAIVRWLRAWAARVRSAGLDEGARRRAMDARNPRFVLRNWLAQEAIDAAEAGDPDAVAELLDVLRRPYDEQPGREHYAERRPEWARHRVGCSMLSCSS